LIVEGKRVRSAGGRGSEQLFPVVWDVRELLGRSAQLRLVDEDGNRGGHLLCDLIELYDADD